VSVIRNEACGPDRAIESHERPDAPGLGQAVRGSDNHFLKGRFVDDLDKPLTLKAAAEALGVPYHVVQRAARKGLVPTYRLGTSRRYVKLRDFIELMNR
jgi:hypothetical protein